MLKLAAVFENALGKNHNWSFNDPDPNKSPEEIRSALDAMTALHLFEKDGMRQFCKVVSAKFVETIETPLFDLSKPTPEAYIADPNNIFAAHIVSEEMNQMPETPVAAEAKLEEVRVEKVAAKEEVIAPEAVEAVQTMNPITKASTAMKAPAAMPESLADVVDQAKNTSIIPSATAQQIEAVTTDTGMPKSDSLTVQNPVNPRKAQVDRVRAYHEANKKKKGKKKKR